MFVHYGPIHILFNMYALWAIGPALERAFGRWRFTAVYLLGGLGGSVACLLLQNPLGATAGASGAIFGLFAALLVLSKRTGAPATQVWIVVGINFVLTFSVPNISIWGHVGGFIFGGLSAFALLAWRLRAPVRLPDVRIQLAGLATLAVVLAGATFVRAESLQSNPPRQSVTYSP